MKLLRLLSILLTSVLSLTQAMAASHGQILVLLSSESALPLQNGKTYASGYYLNELGTPVDQFLKAGYAVTLVTPRGNTPVVDARSLHPRYFGNDATEMQRIQTVVDTLPDLAAPKSLATVLASDLSQYAALFVPGGHAPMIDLANNPKVGELLRYFHQTNKPTAALCHGPIALLAAQDDPQAYEQSLVAGHATKSPTWIYQGYRMTIFSNTEEAAFESSLKGDKMRYYPASALTAAGADTLFAPNWQSHVEVDRELITGQNPFSDAAVAQALLTKLHNTSK
jgi:putative intracellular protease/amidase